MSQQVEAILHQIGQLDEADRKLLEEKLCALAEAEWRQEARTARATAAERGIDQGAIDSAVEDLRYGA